MSNLSVSSYSNHLYLFRDSEIPEKLARDVIKTYKVILAAI